MLTIPESTIDAVWHETQKWSEDTMGQVIADMSDDQPLLMAYLVEVGEELLNDEEQELLFFFGVLLWKMMSWGKDHMEEMTELDLDRSEEANSQLLEVFDGDTGNEVPVAVKKAMDDYNQPFLLNFVVEAVSESLETGAVQMQNFGAMVLYLKVAIDGMDK